MRILLLFIIAGFSYSLPGQAKLYTEKILMDYQSADLKADNLKQIRNVWERLPQDAAVELMLVSEKEIKSLEPLSLVTLSKARADAINLFLTTQKIVSPYDIELNTHLFIENEAVHGTGKSFKRLVRNPYKVYSLILSKEVPVCFNYTDAERRALSSKEPAVFSINAAQDEEITGPGGVMILIPAYSFILPAEKKHADVTIRVWEFLSAGDMLLAGLCTMSAGRLLETGGMIYITADCEGTCLKMLRSAKLVVKFPSPGRLCNMRLFKGIPLPQVIDWQKTDVVDKASAAITEDELPDLESGKMDIIYYSLESASLGWINCDRFSEPGERINVAFTCTENPDVSAGLVFTEISSIMPGEFIQAKSDNVTFSHVPKGKEAVLLLYMLSADKKKILYAARKVVLGEPVTEDIKLTEVTVGEFKQVLKTIKD